MRRFKHLKAVLFLAIALTLPPKCARSEVLEDRTIRAPLLASRHTAEPETYRLRMKHLHTGEAIDVAYRRGDLYLDNGTAMLNHFLRDSRTNEDAHYDVKEFDILHLLMAKLHKPQGVIEVLCGYRSPESNEYLRTLAPVTGVAENSQHMLSKAIDIRVPGVSTMHLRDVARALGMGGVGYYPRSQFVHVDVGPVRQWSFGGRRRLLVAGKRTRRRHNAHNGESG
ncbi:YcbK family protein [Granulicella arctica]|uniref:YcbK family protein n=1 Tax=Granulicella arctica TaxID=940613 RepID=UPI0021E0F0F7|nr:DUF882 domain-containing protein [Granulicella arctica]